MDTEVPEGLPQHLDPKHPDVDTAGIHRAHQQSEDRGGGEEKPAVDAHRDDGQDASSNTHKQCLLVFESQQRHIAICTRGEVVQQLFDRGSSLRHSSPSALIGPRLCNGAVV
ncbi:hypothetical protein EYF80_045731 [Liparis tanakae]|uniref:Uncharacterized protein n=1 Tax=Liparis tanakae TaxID=230148 RepID=A0A4Z2FTM9_9TELE|nr:hypothetical protein EYF80_045731 [Liparis tanakae]